MNLLSERLMSWAQNEEMVDQRFTEHGKDCVEAAERIAELAPDAAIGKVVWCYIDRMTDLTDKDNAERVLKDYLAAMGPVINAARAKEGR